MSKALFYTLSRFQQFQLNFFQQNLNTAKPVFIAKQSINYPFVTLIRFISMIGIVWAHTCLYIGYSNEEDFLNKIGHVELYIPFMQIFKFGVICFFIISGFLLGDKIKTGNLAQYYKRRVQHTFKPFLLVLFIFIIVFVFRIFILHRNLHGIDSITKIVSFCLFQTPLWYLPNYLITLAVTLIFSKYLYSKYFGGLLLLITLLYSIFTVYTIKYQAGYTSAIFGYAFYLWLGINLKYRSNILFKIKKINLASLSILLILSFSLSCLESYKLYQNHLNYFSILRIFNQIYSVIMFIFLVRVCKYNPNFGIFNPKKETYGIYLYHGVLSMGSTAFINHFNVFKAFNLTIPDIYTFMVYHLLFFSIVYFSTTALVKILLKYNFGYLQINKPT